MSNQPRDENGNFTSTERTTDRPADGETKSTKTRWWGTGTLVAVMVSATICLSVLVYVARGGSVPVWVTGTFGLLALAAAAWTFGADALKAARGGGKQ